MKKDCMCKELTCEKNCTRDHTHKTFYCEKCLNKTTQQYQKGMSELDTSYRYSDPSHNEIKSHIKQTTLAILQSEYDRLRSIDVKIMIEHERMRCIAIGDKTLLSARADVSLYYGKHLSITDQQNHLLQTINEIKGL